MRIAYLLALLFISGIGFAQAPQRLSFQAVVRNSDNSFVSNKQISVRLSILKGDINGTVVYSETHSPRTNGLGLFTLEVGGGTVQSGDFSSIEWGGDSYFLKREIDPTGGTNYTISGTSQMLSVPYALQSETSFISNYSLNLPANLSSINPFEFELDLNTNFEVPQGKTFFILYKEYGTNCSTAIKGNGGRIWDWSNMPFLEGTILSVSDCQSAEDNIKIKGYFVDNDSVSLDFINITLNPNEEYTVPIGKVLILPNGAGSCFNNEIFYIFGGQVLLFEGEKLINCNIGPWENRNEILFYSGILANF